MMTEPKASTLEPENDPVPASAPTRIEVEDRTQPLPPEPWSHPGLFAVIAVAAGVMAGAGLWRMIKRWRYVLEQGRKQGPPLGPYRSSNTAN